MRHGTGRHETLGRDDHLIAGPTGQPTANDLFGAADLRIACRIGVGRVEEDHAGVEGGIEDAMGLIHLRS